MGVGLTPMRAMCACSMSNSLRLGSLFIALDCSPFEGTGDVPYRSGPPRLGGDLRVGREDRVTPYHHTQRGRVGRFLAWYVHNSGEHL